MCTYVGMRSTILAPITLVLLAALGGCAPTDEEEPTAAASDDALTLASRPMTAAECKAFVAKNPGESVRFPSGVVANDVFHSCDVNSTALFGTVDLGFAQQLLQGTGRVPIAVVQKGKPPMGLARLYFINYLSTDLGAYNEFILLIDGSEANASADAKTLKWSNPVSALLPAFDPKTRSFMHQLILQKEATVPIEWGRQFGMDKRPGTVDIQVRESATSFMVKDETGAPVVRGAVRPNRKLSGLLKTMTKFAGAAFGEFLTPGDIQMKLHPLTLNQPIEASGLSFSKHPLRPGNVAEFTSNMHWLPSMNEATADNLELELDGSSTLGKMLKDAHFTPAAFVTADHVSMTVEQP